VTVTVYAPKKASVEHTTLMPSSVIKGADGDTVNEYTTSLVLQMLALTAEATLIDSDGSPCT
jgi:hypothetical protein